MTAKLTTEIKQETIFIMGKFYYKDSITKDGSIYLDNFRMIEKHIKNLHEQINIMTVAQAAYSKELKEEVKNFKEVELTEMSETN